MAVVGLCVSGAIIGPALADDAEEPPTPEPSESQPEDPQPEVPSPTGPGDEASGGATVRVAGAGSVEITWIATEPGAVALGRTEAYDRLIASAGSDGSAGTQHLLIDGLECGTDYHYVILAARSTADPMITGVLRILSTHQGDRTFTMPACDAPPRGEPVAVLVPGMDHRDHGAIITWTSEQPGRGTVAYGTSTDFRDAASEAPGSAAPDAGTRSHGVELAGLTCGTEYHYTVINTVINTAVETPSDPTGEGDQIVVERTGPHRFTTGTCDPAVSIPPDQTSEPVDEGTSLAP